MAYSTALLPSEVDFDDKTQALDVEMECDFVIRKDAPLEKLVPDLEKALAACDKSRTLRLTLIEEEREVYVATGKWKLKLRPGRKSEIDVYADEAVINAGLADDPFAAPRSETSLIEAHPRQILREIGAFVNRRIEVDAEMPDAPIKAFTHAWPGVVADRDPDKVLKNVSEQIGLTFTKEMRKVRTLRVRVANSK